MNINPTFEKVAIKIEPSESVTTGGIVLASSSQDRPNKGTITAVGTGKLLTTGEIRPMSVKVGDKVWFAEYQVQQSIHHEKDQYIIISEDDILAVLE